MAIYNIYVKSGRDGSTAIYSASAPNPDDAIYRLVVAGDYIPDVGDVVKHCVLVDTTKSQN